MGRKSRAEIEAAFETYQGAGLQSARSADWSHWGNLFTEDCAYLEHTVGVWGGREAVVREMSALMHLTQDTPWVWVNQYPVDAYVIDEERGWIWSLIWNRMEDPGDGVVLECPCLTMLHYSGNGLFSFEEDLYNPEQFIKMVKEWAERNQRCNESAEDRNKTLEARAAAARSIALMESPPVKAPPIRTQLEAGHYAGRYSRDELETAFEHYCTSLALSGKTNDWRHWGACLMPDATLVDCHLGHLGKREAIVREIETILHRTDDDAPWARLNAFPPAEYVVDEKSGEVWSFFWARFRDPGDGTRHEAKTFARLRYAGNGLWSRIETLYSPRHFQAAMASYLDAKERYDERRERRGKRLAEREKQARKLAPLKELQGDPTMT